MSPKHFLCSCICFDRCVTEGNKVNAFEIMENSKQQQKQIDFVGQILFCPVGLKGGTRDNNI